MENNNVKKIKIDKWDVFVIFDDEDNRYTLTYAGNVRVTISDVDLEKAKKSFIEAMNLAESVQGLVNFSETGNLEK